MTERHAHPSGLRAKIRREVDDRPIELVITAEAAEDLAFIADDFAREVVQDSEEATRLVRRAATLSALIKDCLAARKIDRTG